MSENVLKKDFKSADVQRLRNLMTGKQGERTNAGIGYSKKKDFHEEGSEDIEHRMRLVVEFLVEKQKEGQALTQQELLMLQKAKKYLRVRVSDYYRELEDGDSEDDAQR